MSCCLVLALPLSVLLPGIFKKKKKKKKQISLKGIFSTRLCLLPLAHLFGPKTLLPLLIY